MALRDKYVVFAFMNTKGLPVEVLTVYAVDKDTARAIALERKKGIYEGQKTLVMSPDEELALGVKAALMHGERCEFVGPDDEE